MTTTGRSGALLGACLLLASVASPASAAPTLGKGAPAFRLRDRGGALIALEDFAYGGKQRPRRAKQVVVLDFFRTDCAPCKASMPKLVKLHERYKGKAVKVLLIALLERDKGEQKLDAYLKRTKLPFGVLVDSYGLAGKKYVKHGSGFRIPALFVIDKSGVLRARISGRNDKAFAGLGALIDKLLR